MTTLKSAGRGRWSYNVAGGCADAPGAWDHLHSLLELCKWQVVQSVYDYTEHLDVFPNVGLCHRYYME